jgi:succinate-acetate transporter protein
MPKYSGPPRPVSLFERLADNLFVAFSSYGAFWLSFATILIPNSGVIDAYGTDADMLNDALGIYLLSWMVVTFLFL